MYSSNKLIRTVGLIGACALAATTSLAVSPPPDGGYPDANTAEGEDELFSLATGLSNTALGSDAPRPGSYATAARNTAIVRGE